MVSFSNLRTPPKLRTPTKLSVSFITRRSTPRPTPRSTRGGRVQSLIDKFNGMNQHSDSSVKSTDNINDKGGENSTGDVTMMPAKDKSIRGFKRMKSTSRHDAFLSLDEDKIMSARSCDDGLKRAVSESSPSLPKPPSVSTSTDTANVTNREMGVKTTRDLSLADDDSAFIPQAPTTSSDEPFDVKNLPFECDDEDKENDFVVKDTRALDQTSHMNIRKAWLSANQSSSSSSSAAPKVGKSPEQSLKIDDSWLSSTSSSSAAPIDGNSGAKTDGTTHVLHERHSTHREPKENFSTKSIRNRNLRRLFSDNSKNKLDQNEMINKNIGNVELRDNVQKSEKVNENKENISRAIGNNRSAKFRNSKINAIKMASRRLSPTRSKPPLYNMMQVEPDVPISQQSFSPTGCCVGVTCGKHYGFGRSESDDVDSRMIDEMDGQSADSLTTDNLDIVVNEVNDLDDAVKDIVAENDVCTIEQASTEVSDEDQIPTIEVAQKNNSGQLFAPSRSESPFKQQARSAMAAAGIESVSQSRSKSTDGDDISLNKTNEIGGGIEEITPRQLNTNNEIDTDIDGDVLVMVGSELETIEITKTRSSIPQQQTKSRKVRKSQFHDVARVAMAAAVVAEQTKNNSRDLGVFSSKDAGSFDNDIPVVDGIVEVTTVTSTDDTTMHTGIGDAEEEIFLEEIGMKSNPLSPTTAAAIGATTVGAAVVGTAARNGADEAVVEEEVFLGEIGMNDNSLPPTAACATTASTAAAEERSIIVSASTSSTSSRLHPPPAPAPAPSTLPSQPPKLDYAQLLMPYLVNYGYPPPAAATATMPCYQYPYPAQYGIPPPAPPIYPMQSVYYPQPPPPQPPTATTTTSADGTIYIHL